MTFKSLLWAALCWTVSSPALAQVVCQTVSNGHIFRAEDINQAFSRQQAIATCQRDSRTNNFACESNVVCGDRYQSSGRIACQTVSNGHIFNESGFHQALVRQTTIAACQRDSRTNNFACESNITCGDMNAASAVVCQTVSNGHLFREQGYNRSMVRQTTIAACQRDSRTNNFACESNINCEEGYAYARAACQTTSNGELFRANGPNRSMARQDVIAQCQRHPRTNNFSCESNVLCDENGSVGPVYPGPQPLPFPIDPGIGRPGGGQNPPSVRGELCYVKQTGEWLSGDEFFNKVSNWAKRNNQCAVAKISHVPSSGRIYDRDGSRVAKNRGGLSNSEVQEVLNTFGLRGCERYTCEEVAR